MTRAPIVVAIVALALAAVAAASLRSPMQSPPRSVPCSDIIAHTKWPYVGSHDSRYRYRALLRVVSAPPAYISQVVHLRDGAWPYWEKAGLVVRAGRGPVT